MVASIALTLALALAATGTAVCARQAPGYGHSAIAVRAGEPVFEVDGAPFFVYGAAFFYERLPRDLWAASLERMRELGINTLDLYIPWNWHELTDGNFDFDGRTNSRRDLREVLRLARRFDFKIVLRPGPVIRNEWRNGGYPAWLLQRPEYGMPPHDLLEGRYPPTATLQNAHSDDAAAQWMHNATHIAYARRWLERVLRECEPVADRIVAVALDDDQGAYLDNQTYPAPHLAAYLHLLEGVVRGVTGPREPVFINTYQMKVPASSPVWAMGNWYQSDAYALGDHDLRAAELLRYPVLIVPHVRTAAPPAPLVARVLAAYRRGGGRLVAGVPAAHALLAVLHGAGRRAVVEGVRGASFAPDRGGTLRGFLTVANYGATDLDVRHASVALARGVRLALPPFAVASHSALVAPVGLRLAALDPHFRSDDVVTFSDCMPVGVSLQSGTLTWRNTLSLGGVRLASAPRACRMHARIGGKRYSLAAGADAAAAVRIDPQGVTYRDEAADDKARSAAARGAEVASFVPVGGDARLPANELPAVPSGRAFAYLSDVYRDGDACVVLDNGSVRVVVSPAAGARAFVFEDLATRRNIFTTVGALRDDVALEPPLSQVDRIAKYTHDFPAGTFNRPYDAHIVASGRRATALFRYTAPDVVPHGATYARSLTLQPSARAFDVEEKVDFGETGATLQRAVSVTSLSVGERGTATASTSTSTRRVFAPQATTLAPGASLHVATGRALGYYDGATHELATIAWRAGDVEDALLSARGASLVVRLTLAPGHAAHVRYGYEFAASLDAARNVVDAADRAAQRAPQGA